MHQVLLLPFSPWCLRTALPVRNRLRATLERSALTCVSLARFSLARFILTRFQFGAFLFGALPLRRVSLWRVSQFCTNLRWSGTCERQFRADYLCACFFSAFHNFCYLSWCIIGYLIICFLSARVFCEEVLSTPVLLRSHSTRLTFAYHFLRVFTLCVIYLLIISTRQRWLHHSELVYLRCFCVCVWSIILLITLEISSCVKIKEKWLHTRD